LPALLPPGDGTEVVEHVSHAALVAELAERLEALPIMGFRGRIVRDLVSDDAERHPRSRDPFTVAELAIELERFESMEARSRGVRLVDRQRARAEQSAGVCAGFRSRRRGEGRGERLT